jgi:hypothetical protein
MGERLIIEALINTVEWRFQYKCFLYKISCDSGDIFINVEGCGISFSEKINGQDRKRDKEFFSMIIKKINKIDAVMQKARQARHTKG